MADHRDAPFVAMDRGDIPDFVLSEATFTPVAVPMELELSAPTFNSELTFHDVAWPGWAPPPAGDLFLVWEGGTSQVDVGARGLVVRWCSQLAGLAPCGRAAQGVSAQVAAEMPGGNFRNTNRGQVWGLAASMRRPGGNVTGVTADVGVELVTKHLELLKELTPTASRLGLLAPKAVLESVYARTFRHAAEKVGATIIPLSLESPINEAEYRRVFAAIAAEQVHGLLVGDTPENFANRSLIFELAADHRVPAMYPVADYARGGGLMAYGLCFPSLCEPKPWRIEQIARAFRFEAD